MQNKVVLIDYEEKYANTINEIEELLGCSVYSLFKECGSKPCKCTNVVFVKGIK